MTVLSSQLLNQYPVQIYPLIEMRVTKLRLIDYHIYCNYLDDNHNEIAEIMRIISEKAPMIPALFLTMNHLIQKIWLIIS